MQSRISKSALNRYLNWAAEYHSSYLVQYELLEQHRQFYALFSIGRFEK